jgi:hypothetical protein
MNYAVEMGSDGMFHEDWFRHPKFVGGDTHKDAQTEK